MYIQYNIYTIKGVMTLKKISKESPIPLYYQLKELIQEQIEDEIFKPGDPIPTEMELCQIHNISRMTVNKAIMSLVHEGLLYREQGRGTFVAENKRKHQLNNLKGFTEEMMQKGYSVETKILSFETVEATKNKKEHLKLGEKGEKIIEIKRLRYIENEPFALETAWIPFKLCPDLDVKINNSKSLYEIFQRKYGYILAEAKQTIEPIMINDYESELLNLRKNSLALLFRRTTYLDDGQIIEYTKAIYRSDKHKYELILKP